MSSKTFKLCDLNLKFLKSEITDWCVKEIARQSCHIKTSKLDLQFLVHEEKNLSLCVILLRN